MWDNEFELPDGSSSVSDIKEYIKCITKDYIKNIKHYEQFLLFMFILIELIIH